MFVFHHFYSFLVSECSSLSLPPSNFGPWWCPPIVLNLGGREVKNSRPVEKIMCYPFFFGYNLYTSHDENGQTYVKIILGTEHEWYSGNTKMIYSILQHIPVDSK